MHCHGMLSCVALIAIIFLNGAMATVNEEAIAQERPQSRASSDNSETWDLVYAQPNRESTATLTIHHTVGGGLTAQWISEPGTSKISEVKREGDQLTFVRTLDLRRGTFVTKFLGKIEGNRLVGVLNGSAFGEQKVRGTRRAQRAVSERDRSTDGNSPSTKPTMSTEELLKLTPDGVTVIPDIAYRAGNEAWKLDLAMPKQRGDAPRAAIVYIHGGGWTKGDKRGQGIGAVLGNAAKGYVSISVNYRLDVDKKACVEDVKCAIRWLRAHAEQYNVDPDRIGAAGNSAGAHLALMLAVCPASAGLEGDGPYQEYSSMVQSAHCSSTPIMPGFRKGKSSNQDVRKIQPMTYISADVPPLYFIHGTEDTKAPVRFLDDFVKALREAGAKDITYKRYAGTGHGAYVKHIEEARPAREAFLERTLMK